MYRKHTVAGLLSITIVTLLITSNVISRVQAKEQEERKAQFNETQTPVYKSDSVIEALKVQKRNTLNIVPESYVEQTNHVDESQRGNRLRRDLPNFEFFFKDFGKQFSPFDAPSNRTGEVNYYGSRTIQRYNVYDADNVKDALYGSRDVLIGNTFSDNPNGTNVYGPILIQENNTYRGKSKKAQYGASVTQFGNNYPKNSGKNDIFTAVVMQNGNTYPENPGSKNLLAVSTNQSDNTYPKSIENNKDALKPFIHQSGNFYPSSNDSEAGMNTKNNTESQVHSAEQNATDSHGNSSSTNYDSDSSSHIENNTLYNKETETYADMHTQFNRQISLSSNVFYSLSFSLIIIYSIYSL